MAFERVTYKSIGAKPGFLGTFALMGIPAFLYGWLQSGESVVGIALAVLAFIIAIVIWEFRRNHSRLLSAMEAFKQRGYNLDFQMGILLIDSKAKVLAFVNLNQRTMDYYSTRDIRQWELQWVDRTTVTANAWGASANTRATQNALVIETNNPHCPIYRVPCLGHSMGQTWMARLSAIIHS